MCYWKRDVADIKLETLKQRLLREETVPPKVPKYSNKKSQKILAERMPRRKGRKVEEILGDWRAKTAEKKRRTEQLIYGDLGKSKIGMSKGSMKILENKIARNHQKSLSRF